MSDEIKRRRQESLDRSEMQRSWNAAEWLIRERVEQLDHLLFKLSQEASTLSVSVAYRNKFMVEHLIEMIDQVAAKREEEERQGVRGRKRG